MKKINVKQLIDKKVRIKFIDNNLEEGWFSRDKNYKDIWNISFLNNKRNIKFRKLHIKTITLLKNNQIFKCDEIDFEE